MNGTEHFSPHIVVPDPTELLKTKVTLAINRIMANYLTNLEQLADEHDEAMGKLIDTLPPEYKANVHLADIYGDTRFEAIRKFVLKSGNDGRREIEEMIDFLKGTK
jgi:hypothetical protein